MPEEQDYFIEFMKKLNLVESNNKIRNIFLDRAEQWVINKQWSNLAEEWEDDLLLE